MLPVSRQWLSLRRLAPILYISLIVISSCAKTETAPRSVQDNTALSTLQVPLKIGEDASATAQQAAPRPPPPIPYRGVSKHVVSQDVQLFTLGTVLATDAPGNLTSAGASGLVRYAVTFVVFARTATGNDVRTVPVGNLQVADGSGGQYPVTYQELGQSNGVTVGAVSFRPAQRGRKTLSVSVPTVEVSGPGLASTQIQSGWLLPILDQVVDEPHGPSRLGIPAENPVNVNGTIVRRWMDSEFGRISIEGPSGSKTLYPRIEHPTGRISVLTYQEWQRLSAANSPPSPRANFTPGPLDPIYQNTPVPTPLP